MAKLPKMKYKSASMSTASDVSNVVYNGNEVLNIVKDGVTVYHKHKEGKCLTKNYPVSTQCKAKVGYTLGWNVDYSHSPSIYAYVFRGVCPTCGGAQDDVMAGAWYEQVPTYSDNDVSLDATHTSGTGTCNRWTTSYVDNYTCGFDAT